MKTTPKQLYIWISFHVHMHDKIGFRLIFDKKHIYCSDTLESFIFGRLHSKYHNFYPNKTETRRVRAKEKKTKNNHSISSMNDSPFCWLWSSPSWTILSVHFRFPRYSISHRRKFSCDSSQHFLISTCLLITFTCLNAFIDYCK